MPANTNTTIKAKRLQGGGKWRGDLLYIIDVILAEVSFGDILFADRNARPSNPKGCPIHPLVKDHLQIAVVF